MNIEQSISFLAPSQIKNKNEKSKYSIVPIKGYLYGVIASSNYCVANIMIKMSRELSPTDHLVIMYGIQLIFAIGILNLVIFYLMYRIPISSWDIALINYLISIIAA